MAEFVLEKFLPYQLAVLASLISDRFSRQYMDKFDISVPEWRVIAHLSQADKISIREIHKKVGMDKSKTSRAADRLVGAGYVSKKTNPDDRRLIELSLTKQGREMMAEITPLCHRFQNQVLDTLTATQRQVLPEAIQKMLESMA